METPKILAPRRVGLALLLTLFGAGIGHIYAGRGGRGGLFFAIQLLQIPVLIALAWLPAGTYVLMIFGGLVLGSMAFYVFALVDGALSASRAERPYVARVYNRASLYVALIVLSAIWGSVGIAALRTWGFEAFRLPTMSMEPTVPRGGRILVNKRPWQTYERGDIVVFRPPNQPDRVFLKRIIAFGGETVLLKGGVIHIDDEPIEDFIAPTTEKPRSEFPVLVPKGHVYVLGDNRLNSSDSRSFGTVPIEDVFGKAEYIWSKGFGPLR